MICDRCGHVKDKPEWQETCNCHLHDEIERLKAFIADRIHDATREEMLMEVDYDG